jgi:hypothetical protein
MVGPGTV